MDGGEKKQWNFLQNRKNRSTKFQNSERIFPVIPLFKALHCAGDGDAGQRGGEGAPRAPCTGDRAQSRGLPCGGPRGGSGDSVPMDSLLMLCFLFHWQ